MQMGDELWSLSKQNGCWVATFYNRLCGYWHDMTFLWYSKKEVIWQLRHFYGVKVGRAFI